MRPGTYSTYEAKARFSEILRKVRAGESVFISYRGEVAAEIRPVKERESVEERLRRLEQRGVLGETPSPGGRLSPIERKAGALERFLESRE